VVEVPTIEATCQSPKSTFHEAHIFNFNLDTLNKLGEKVGFTQVEHKVSADGANITVFFQKNEINDSAVTQQDFKIPGNAEKIVNIVSHHTPFRHYLTAWPYQRFFTRMGKALSEKLATAGFVSGKALLDKLYA
jgi:hypothetical protein